MKRTTLTFLLFALAATLAAQEVTLPLSRYEELRQQANPEPEPEPKPPVPVAFEQAELAVTVGETSATITQDLVLALYGDGWQSVALSKLGTFIDADFGGLEGRLETGTSPSLKVRGSGRHRVRLTSVIGVHREESTTRPTWRLRLETPKAALVRGSLKVGGDVEEVTANGQVLVDERGDDGRRTFVAAPGAAFGLTLQGTATVPERDELPLRFDVTSAAALTVARDERRVRAWIAARVLQGRLAGLTVPLPDGFKVVRVDGPVAGWDVVGDRLDNHYSLSVTPLEAVTASLALTVELSAPPGEELSSVVLGVTGAAGTLYSTKATVEGDGLLNVLDPGDARQADSGEMARLPDAFRQAGGLALVLEAGARPPRWQVTWSESTEVLAAQVDRLLVDVVVGTAGRAAYQLWAEVRSTGAPQLVVVLPGGELVAARRDGSEAVPGQTAEGWAMTLTATAQSQVFYLSALLPLSLPERDGTLEIPLPSFSAPVGRVELRCHLPGDGRSYTLSDTTRAGGVRGVPIVRSPGETPELARQLRLAGHLDGGVAPGFFSPPAGFALLQASWSALSATPAPLGIRVDQERTRRDWF